MNFLNGGCLGRFCRVQFWSSPCCKERAASAPLVIHEDTRPKPRSKISISPLNCGCLRKNLVLPSLTFWTQVRFNNSQNNEECPYPKFHRDMIHPNFDAYRKDEYKDLRKTGWGMGDGKPGYTYAIGFFGWLCGSYAIKSEITHFVSYMSAAADVLAMATIEVELGKIAPGACVSYKWRGKPLFIKHRTQADIDSEANTPMSALRDPQTPEQRAPKPEWLIVIGICTHLGCVPIPNSGDWPGGFYCPCHGSHYDNVGRARKGPAPLNLEVPPYTFVSDSLVLVG